MTVPRNIILLSNGTGNARGKLEKTNVWRVYEALDLEDPLDPPQPRQFAFYDDGVGTSSFRPLAILGGALGYGLARNVRDLYEFLCRTYRDGDRIYAFGFSRGAFTIRVLIGLITSQGLVPCRGREAELRRFSKAAFRAYRRERCKLFLNWIAAPRMLRDSVIDAWTRLRGQARYATVAKRMVDIHFVGVWDTVSAYGMPIDEIATFINALVWPLEMPDSTLSPKVRRAVHALALDDERYTFHPKLWDPEERIKQVWFAGMHSDVGGGYADKGLAHISLRWILDEADDGFLRLNSDIRNQQDALADENGPMNDSRRGVAGYYRYKPRHLPPGALIHKSVLRRIRVGQDAYAPIVLPPDFRVLNLDGNIQPGAVLTDIDLITYRDGHDQTWNRVWLRRGIYFLTVVATLTLLLMPLLRSNKADACTVDWCWLSPAIRALQVVLPSILEYWAVWYAANPDVFVLLGSLTIAAFYFGAVVQRWIFDSMRRVWYAIPLLRPTSVEAGYPPACQTSRLGNLIVRFRTSKGYQRWISLLRWKILPAGAGIVLATVVLMLANTFWFSVKASAGHFCIKRVNVQVVGQMWLEDSFATKDVCAATGLALQAGGTYDIVLTIPNDEPWMDRTLKTDLRGIQNPSLLQRLVAPMKRELSHAFFTPLARIGKKGADVYPLTSDPSQPHAESRTLLATRVVARTNGELFIYVNDVVGPPWEPLLFYRNNHGRATVAVRQVVPSKRETN